MQTETHAPITHEHLCDKCGVQAKVRATLINGDLYFCGHHAKEVATPLVVKSIEVFDPEGTLNAR